jgi:hypothetical protein
MLTQQELVDRLNQLTLRYNLTWFDIKYDADKAIHKINNFMGTKYPKLSEILINPSATYTINTSETYTDVEENVLERPVSYEIIKEEYFHSVIIPYIAMEVLSRDEEFTTIYNKYLTEMQEGLYDMFQKEFNKVPFEFRQDPMQGVFFEIDSALGKHQHNERNLNIPTFKFRIKYFANKNDIVLAESFTTDLKSYTYDEEAVVLFWPKTTKLYSSDYSKIYTFEGWSRAANINQVAFVEPVAPAVTTIKMKENISLYALWSEQSTLTVGTTGLRIIQIQAQHRPSIENLVIPNYVNGLEPLTVPTNFVLFNQPALETDRLKAIYLPTSIITLQSNAFTQFQGTVIKLNEGLENIGSNAFAQTPNLTEIIIPSTVKNISVGAFPVVPNKYLVIKVRLLENNIPDTWLPGWYSASTSNYTVKIIWGYNG